MRYKVTCTDLNGNFRQVDEFNSLYAAERWANAVNKVGYWKATIEEVDESESE